MIVNYDRKTLIVPATGAAFANFFFSVSYDVKTFCECCLGCYTSYLATLRF